MGPEDTRPLPAAPLAVQGFELPACSLLRGASRASWEVGELHPCSGGVLAADCSLQARGQSMGHHRPLVMPFLGAWTNSNSDVAGVQAAGTSWAATAAVLTWLGQGVAAGERPAWERPSRRRPAAALPRAQAWRWMSCGPGSAACAGAAPALGSTCALWCT